MNGGKAGFELFEHLADVGVRGFGRTLAEAFENGAKAMFSIMVNLETVDPLQKREVYADAFDRETLFTHWLNELIAMGEIEYMLFSEFRVLELEEKKDGWYIRAHSYGEPIDPTKHNLKTDVKAATYSLLKIKEEDCLYIVQCLVDV